MSSIPSILKRKSYPKEKEMFLGPKAQKIKEKKLKKLKSKRYQLKLQREYKFFNEEEKTEKEARKFQKMLLKSQNEIVRNSIKAFSQISNRFDSEMNFRRANTFSVTNKQIFHFKGNGGIDDYESKKGPLSATLVKSSEKIFQFPAKEKDDLKNDQAHSDPNNIVPTSENNKIELYSPQKKNKQDFHSKKIFKGRESYL